MRLRTPALAAGLALIGLALAPPAARAGVVVYDSGPTPYGNTNALSSQWWQWAYSIPSTSSPLLDPTGANAYQNNNGPVFFLAGQFGVISLPSMTFVGSAHRSITIQAGTPVYFPILNLEFDNIGGPAFGFNLMSTADLRSTAASFSALDQAMYARIDGVDVLGNPANHHDLSPTPFDITLPNNNLYQFNGFDGVTQDFPGHTLPDVPAGFYAANAKAFPNGGVVGIDPLAPADFARNSPVGDGYYILAQLSPGFHEIEFGGSVGTPGAAGTFTLAIVYDITVIPEPGSLLLFGTGLAGAAGLRWRRKRRA